MVLMNLDGVTALVSGGASGLGLATAEAFHERGARVVVLDLPPARERIEALGRFAFAAADVRDETQVAEAIGIAQEGGELRVCINCAGIGRPGRTVGREGPMPLDDFRHVLDVNLIGTFNVMRLAAAAMAGNEAAGGERGVIVNTASIAAYDGQIGQASYAASKGGIVALTLPVARDLSSLQIRVMTIAPGLFHTPLFDTLTQEQRDQLAAAVPHPPRLGDPVEFAALATHIVENPMLNGEVIRLDGALRMAPR
jgi:NAD(P)-dependent dehydrogenase (short-subunit alcohol dehydrogenase family)